jgi:drug/metabolite transporter (DMT)-like permease
MTFTRLTVAQIALLSLYVAGMASGQILFKMAAQRAVVDGTFGERIVTLAGNVYFLAAFMVYSALAVLWVWILTFTPLSRAYPLVALVIAITPLLGAFLFDEPVTLRLILGILTIALGLAFVMT